MIWWYFTRDSHMTLLCFSEQDGRCVGVFMSTWRPRYPSCSSAGCVAFALNSCGATSTGLWCRVWPVCTAASGDATRGTALSRETAAAARSEPASNTKRCTGHVWSAHCPSQYAKMVK